MSASRNSHESNLCESTTIGHLIPSKTAASAAWDALHVYQMCRRLAKRDNSTLQGLSESKANCRSGQPRLAPTGFGCDKLHTSSIYPIHHLRRMRCLVFYRTLYIKGWQVRYDLYEIGGCIHANTTRLRSDLDTRAAAYHSQ